MLAAASSSVEIWHTLEPFGHAAMSLGCSFICARAQESIHVVTKLANGILHTSDVQPADDHPEELQRERLKEDRRREKGDKERETEMGGGERERQKNE